MKYKSLWSNGYHRTTLAVRITFVFPQERSLAKFYFTLHLILFSHLQNLPFATTMHTLKRYYNVPSLKKNTEKQKQRKKNKALETTQC